MFLRKPIPMLLKIKREQSLDKYPKFPQSGYKNEVYSFPKAINNYILSFESKSTRGHIKLLSQLLCEIASRLNYKHLVFLGDYKRPWLYQNNSYKPVKRAMQYLIANKVGKNFDGALFVDTADLSEFSKHLYWLVRCNAALPIFNFLDEEQNIVGSICHYGNIHLSTLNKRADKQLMAIIEKNDFIIIKSAC
jgi:hypothetical protein